MRSCFFRMRCGLRLGLIAALLLTAQLLHSQDSSDSGDSGDTSDSSDTGSADATATGPADGYGVVDNAAADPAVDPAALSQNEAIDPATQQAIDAVTTPWGGVPAPATNLVSGPGDISVPGGRGSRARLCPARQRSHRSRLLRLPAFPRPGAHKFTR